MIEVLSNQLLKNHLFHLNMNKLNKEFKNKLMLLCLLINLYQDLLDQLQIDQNKIKKLILNNFNNINNINNKYNNNNNQHNLTML